MKKYLILCLVAAGMAVIGCKPKEFTPGPEGGRVVTVRAVSAPLTDGTKVLADDAGKFTWEKGDVIGVWTGSALTQFTLNDECDGMAEGTFTGILPEGGAIDENSYAVYPYDYVTVSGTTATLNVNSSFWARSAPARLVPMYAKAGTGHTSGFAFKHLGAVAKFSIENLPEEIIAIYLECQLPADPRTIWGKNGTTADLTVDEPQWGTDARDEGYAFAIPSDAASYEKLDVYVPVVPGTYSNELTFKVKMFKDSGASEVGDYTKTGKLSSKSTTYTRGQLLSMPTITFPKAETGGIQATIQGGSRWNAGATLGLYNGTGFNALTLAESSDGAITGIFEGGIPESVSYAVCPASPATLNGTMLKQEFNRWGEYPATLSLYGTASATETFEMKHNAAAVKVTLKNVPAAATHCYFESWSSALMMSEVETNLSTGACTYGAGIDWAFATLPAHSEGDDVTIYCPIRPGEYDSINWCLCYTSAGTFGNELSDKTRFYSFTTSPIVAGTVIDLGEATLTLK